MNITLTSPPVSTYTVTASGDAHVSVSPVSQNASYNIVAIVTLTLAPGYAASIASDTCGGNLLGTTYTTGAVRGMCSVSFRSSLMLIPSVVAVGTYVDTSAIERPLLAFSQDLTSWSYPESITAPVFTPNNPYPFGSRGGFFYSASCTGVTCIAVGTYYDTNLIQRPLLALSQDLGTSWSYPDSITAPVFTPNNTYPAGSSSFLGASTNSLWLPKSLHFLIK